MADIQWEAEEVRLSADPICGATIQQLTSEPVTSHNIYCEQRYASADGQRIAIARKPYRQPVELWVADLSLRKLCFLMEGTPRAANSLRNAVYVIDAENRLLRADLSALKVEELYRFPTEKQADRGVSDDAPKGTVSPDERWFVAGPFHVRDSVYSLHLIDIASGKKQVLCEVEDMFNPHMQFDLSDSSRLLVQINRGGSPPWIDDGRGLAGPEGSTLAVVDVPSGKVTPLPIGKPHSGRISGHLCWVGQSGSILSTGAPGVHPGLAAETGIYQVTPGDERCRQLISEMPFNHIAASDDGRFYIVDNYRTQDVYVGSVATGKFLEFCHSQTEQGRPQHTHVHPYMTPDNQHIIYNSTRTGVAQVYAAKIPEGFLDQVLAL